MAVLGLTIPREAILPVFKSRTSTPRPRLRRRSFPASSTLPSTVGHISLRRASRRLSRTPTVRTLLLRLLIRPISPTFPVRLRSTPRRLWRVSMQDWGKGAGQEYLDRRASQSQYDRFYTSKGIYPWQQNRASLLNDTVAVHSSGAELQVLVVGSFVYINDNGTIRVSSGNLSSWTGLTLAGGATASTTNAAMATDGNNLYIACSTGIILDTTSTSSTTNASWINGTDD